METNHSCRQTGRWFQAYKGLNEALKELGDVRTWASVMENDMKAIVIALNDAEDILQGQKQNQNKWNGSQK